MATALTGRTWRPSALDRIESDLVEVWAELAREAPVARAALSNLVVFCRTSAGAATDLDSEPAGIPLEQVARQHPARVIVLKHDPDTAIQRSGAPDARVGVITFGPADARFGIEEIVVRSACSDAALPSIVLPLLRGDVPTSIWWTEDFSSIAPLAPLAAMGRQLLYDSRRWRDVRAAVLGMEPLLSARFCPDLADVNWRRLTPVRQALTYAIRSRAGKHDAVPETIRITCLPAEGALGWLLAGWLEQILCTPGLNGPPEIALEANLPPGDLLKLSFGTGLELCLSDRSVTVTDTHGPAPFAVAVPQEDEAGAIASELHALTPDASFHGALATLAARLARA